MPPKRPQGQPLPGQRSRHIRRYPSAPERHELRPSRAGEWVFLAISSANRDPAQFPDPDRLDLSRDTSGHLAFGQRAHYCLGAPLARLEAEVALAALLARFPELSLALPAEQLR